VVGVAEMPEGGRAWRRAWEPLALAAILGLAGWLRLRQLDLVEFKLDEATAMDLARRLLDGHFQTAGLTSSIGARDPPFFVYLIAIPLGLRDHPLVATGFIGALAVAAVALTYRIVRSRFGVPVALAAAALFATAPWAVLYGRKIWPQDALPIFTVSLLWAFFAVLERERTRVAVLIPVLVCVGFQLNFSALALALPAAALLAARARHVHWPALGLGVVCAALLLAPWLVYEAHHGFGDAVGILTQGRGNRGSSPLGSGSIRAARETVHILGSSGWDYVAGSSYGAFVSGAGWEWRWAKGANVVTAALLVLGLLTNAVHVVRGSRRPPGRRLPTLQLDAARRAVVLAWLLGIWLSYVASAPGRLAPHYLIVTYPVSFVVQAVGLSDLARAGMRWSRRVPVAAALALVVVVVAGYTAFSVSFQRFLGRNGGTVGDYGVVYRDKASLAAVVRRRGFRVANEPVVDFLTTGRIEAPSDRRPLVTVRNRLRDESAPVCDGTLRSFGALVACLPAGPR